MHSRVAQGMWALELDCHLELGSSPDELYNPGKLSQSLSSFPYTMWTMHVVRICHFLCIRLST